MAEPEDRIAGLRQAIHQAQVQPPTVPPLTAEALDQMFRDLWTDGPLNRPPVYFAITSPAERERKRS